MASLDVDSRPDEGGAVLRIRKAVQAIVPVVARRFGLDAQFAFWMRERDPTWSRSDVRARVVGVVDESRDRKTFILAPNGLWRGHRAGQFVPVIVEVDGVRMARRYALSATQTEAHIAITVNRTIGDRVSTWLHDRVRPGDVLCLGLPGGEFGSGVPRPRVAAGLGERAPRRLTEAEVPGPRRIVLVRSGRTLAVKGQRTVLEELENAGETPKHGCRIGMCNTCSSRKRSGIVENVITGAMSSEAEEDIRLCVSIARSDLQLEL